MEINLDHNATTPLSPEVFAAMSPYLSGFYGNASSRHSAGRQARRAIDQARRQIADALDVNPQRILFTSGATEANNLAIFSLVGPAGTRIAINPTEHPSALAPVKELARRGVAVDMLYVDSEGLIANFERNLQIETKLVIVHLANNETGAIQPIEAMARQAPQGIAFHCDAAQGVGKIPVRFHELGVTTMSVAGHKIGGPTGIGALLMRDDAKLEPQLFGGKQQDGLRPGTEPVAQIVGLAAAIERATANVEERGREVARLRDLFETLLSARIDNVVRNGPKDKRLPNTSNLSFVGARAEAVTLALDLEGVLCSAGSACASGAVEPSPVLVAMGIASPRLESAVRFSLGAQTTEAEVRDAAERVARVVRNVKAALDTSSK